MKKLVCVLPAVLAAGGASCGQSPAVKITGNVKTTGNVVYGVSNTVIVPADYYVSPATGMAVSPCTNGSDSNDGTTPATGGGHGPFATLDHARSVVRASGKLGTKPLTIAFCGGLYLNQSTSFTSADSGSATNPVTYKAYPGQFPILSGGVQFTGWTNINGNAICNGNTNCWQRAVATSTPYFEALYYNGARRARPRTGATAGHTFDAKYGNYAAGGSGATMKYTSGDVDMSGAGSWTNLTDIIMYDQEKWVQNILRNPASITTSTQKVVWNCSTSGQGNGKCPQANDPGQWFTGDNYVFENVKQLLRFAGQWYLDRGTTPTWA